MSELFTSDSLTILILPNIVIHARKILQKKMNLLKMCGLRIRLCLFTTHCVETVEYLNYNHYSHLTCRDNASALGVRGPGFNFQLRQKIYV